jgi:hypothetical protein
VNQNSAPWPTSLDTPMVIAAIAVQPLTAAAVMPTAVAIAVAPVQTRLHRGDGFDVELRTTNNTRHLQAFRIMSCSWAEAWKTDDAQIDASPIACTRNGEITLRLAPGATDVRTLNLEVAKDAALGTHTFRLGFTPIGSRDTLWSAAASVNVVAVGSAITVSGRAEHPRPGTTGST